MSMDRIQSFCPEAEVRVHFTAMPLCTLSQSVSQSMSKSSFYFFLLLCELHWDDTGFTPESYLRDFCKFFYSPFFSRLIIEVFFLCLVCCSSSSNYKDFYITFLVCWSNVFYVFLNFILFQFRIQSFPSHCSYHWLHYYVSGFIFL